MAIVYFVNPMANWRKVYVHVLGDEPLVYGKGYRVQKEIIPQLLATGDWSTEPPEQEEKQEEEQDK